MWYGTFKNGIGIKHPFSDWRLLLNEEKELDTAKDLANKHKKNEVMLLFDNYDILSDKVQKFLVTPTSIVEHWNEIWDDFRKNWKTSPDYIGEYGLKGAKKLITK
jgi:hypothetical protein